MTDWSRWFHQPKVGKSFADIQEEGNLSAVLPGGPAERARQLGLQSNGRGSYIDPNTGQVAARTVNGELVFYSQDGGAIADSSGGSQLSKAQPSWGDPITGMLVTPPGKAESPAEIASIPDAVPATPPAGYNDFMKRKKDQAYQMNAIAPQPMRMTPDEEEEQQQQQQDMTPDQGQAFGEAAGDAAKKMAGSFEKMKQNTIKAQEKDTKDRAKAVQKGGTDPESLMNRLGMGQPASFATMRQRMLEQDLPRRTMLTDPKKIKSRQALRATTNKTPDDALQAIKAPKDITKDTVATKKYLDKVKSTIDNTYADSEKDMEPDEAKRQRAGSRQAQRDIIQGKGAFGASNDELDDFKSNMAKARAQRNKQELDSAGDLPTPTINVSRDKIGKGSETSKIESAQLFALQRVFGGTMPGDFDLEKDIQDIYGQNADKVRSSISGARELFKHLGYEPGEVVDDYDFGKFDGQSTTIGDEDRTSLYDDIFGDILMGLGRKSLPPQRVTARNKRDWTNEELRKEGSKMLGNLTGTDPGAGIKDNWQTADVYMSRKGMKEKIRNDIGAIMDNFGDQPNVAMMLVQGYLSKQHNARNLLGISLKELSPGAQKMKVTEYNRGLDDWVDVINSHLEGNLNLNYNLGDSTKRRMGEFDFGSNSMTFDGELKGKRGDDGDEDFNLPFQWESRPSGSSDTLKVEPNDKFIVDRGKEANTGQMRRKTGHLGMLSQKKMNDIMKEATGEDLDYMLPNRIGEPFTDDMKAYWKETIQELMNSDSPFGDFGDGLKFMDQDVEPDEWIDKLTNSVDMSALSNDKFEQQYGIPRSQKTHTAVRNKLRHLRIMKSLVDAHKEGKGHSLLGKFLLGAGKINQGPNEFYAPRIQLS